MKMAWFKIILGIVAITFFLGYVIPNIGLSPTWQAIISWTFSGELLITVFYTLNKDFSPNSIINKIIRFLVLSYYVELIKSKFKKTVRTHDKN